MDGLTQPGFKCYFGFAGLGRNFLHRHLGNTISLWLSKYSVFGFGNVRLAVSTVITQILNLIEHSFDSGLCVRPEANFKVAQGPNVFIRLLDDPIVLKSFSFGHMRERNLGPPIAAHGACDLIIIV